MKPLPTVIRPSSRTTAIVAVLAALAFGFGDRLRALETVLLKGATVHTISGETYSPGEVLVRDGKITAVGPNVSSAGAVTVDLTGQHLYPGLILLDSVLGLTEISAVRATGDMSEVGDYTPDVESWIAVNPDSELIPVTRANGIAYFEPVPLGSVVSGQSGLMVVDGWTSEQMVFKKPLALHVFWPEFDLDTSDKPAGKTKPKSLEDQAKERQAKVQATVDFFEEAKAYATARAAAAQGRAPAPQHVPAWEAMLPYVRGELPVMVHADEIRQIRSALAWAGTNHYRVVLVGGRDAAMAAKALAAARIPVIYSQTFTLPTRDTEAYDVHFAAPAVLHRAGVPVAFSVGPRPFDAPLARNLPYSAAQAVAFGLPPDEALKGLTLYPAQFAGVSERLGSIEVGKEATLCATDGDILDLRAHVRHLWLHGQEVSLENRQTRLYEKYRRRPSGATADDAAQSPGPVPLLNAHGHNDYEHKHPLLDALAQGFCSVEADVHLVQGQLLVAHTRMGTRPGRTLQALYLDPLRARVQQNGGRVYPSQPEFTLLVELKDDWRTSYPTLRQVLHGYTNILSSFHEGQKEAKAITVIITGHRAKEMFTGEAVRYAAIDGELAELKGDAPADLVPWISSDWAESFKWRGTGPLPEADKLKLEEIVAQAHRQGRRVRFWGAPDQPLFWQAMLDHGVDLLNTDDLEGMAKFLNSRR